jgi:hypothetical protein
VIHWDAKVNSVADCHFQEKLVAPLIASPHVEDQQIEDKQEGQKNYATSYVRNDHAEMNSIRFCRQIQ